MKKNFNVFLLVLFLCFCTKGAVAQTNMKVKTFQPVAQQHGFYVVESTLHNPLNAVVYFYNNDKQLVYKEAVNHQRLNLRKKKTRQCLNVALEQALNLSKPDAMANRSIIKF